MCTCVPKSLLTGPLQSKLNIINAEMAYDIASLASSQCAATQYFFSRDLILEAKNREIANLMD